MSLATSESRQFGLKKEAVRGTPEAAATVWRAVTVDSELDYSRAFLDDEAKRGISAKFPAKAGVKSGKGTIKLPMRASEVGEFLHMLTSNPVSTLVGPALAYSHVFTVPSTVIQPPSYTAWFNRGAAVAVKRYALLNAAALTFSGDAEGLANMEAEMMFKSEDDDATPGTPSYANESEQLTSYETVVKLDGVANAQVKEYSVKLENNLFAQRTLNASADVKDLIAVGPHKMSGSFTMYLEDEAERTKFLAGTQLAFELKMTGSAIDGGFFHDLAIAAPKVKYRAQPFGDTDGLLGVQAEFEAEYSVADSKLYTATLINKVTSY
jgi:hypothetical protein